MLSVLSIVDSEGFETSFPAETVLGESYTELESEELSNMNLCRRLFSKLSVFVCEESMLSLFTCDVGACSGILSCWAVTQAVVHGAVETGPNDGRGPMCLWNVGSVIICSFSISDATTSGLNSAWDPTLPTPLSDGRVTHW